jgi:hypothetical protein
MGHFWATLLLSGPLMYFLLGHISISFWASLAIDYGPLWADLPIFWATYALVFGPLLGRFTSVWATLELYLGHLWATLLLYGLLWNIFWATFGPL